LRVIRNRVHGGSAVVLRVDGVFDLAVPSVVEDRRLRRGKQPSVPVVRLADGLFGGFGLVLRPGKMEDAQADLARDQSEGQGQGDSPASGDARGRRALLNPAPGPWSHDEEEQESDEGCAGPPAVGGAELVRVVRDELGAEVALAVP